MIYHEEHEGHEENNKKLSLFYISLNSFVNFVFFVVKRLFRESWRIVEFIWNLRITYAEES